MNNILILNAGSSSLKFKLFEHNGNFKVIASGQFSQTNTNHPSFKISCNENTINQTFSSSMDMKELLNVLNNNLKATFPNLVIKAIGHRVVHGGDIYQQPTLVDNQVIENLKSIIYLTPIHLPHNIAPMEVCNNIFPNVPQVACFDTSFHSTIPELNRTYAIPRELTEQEKIKRYGFHGLSYEYLIGQLMSTHPEIASKKVVIAHLGAGASICALEGGKSIDTTMGLTPLEGLVMATRCGTIDPAIILHLMKKGLNYQEITDIVYFKSGLLGISQETGDFITLNKSTNPKAKQAYQIFTKSITKHILSLTASLQGIDALVFSGGIGENSQLVRNDVLMNLEWLGFKIDSVANANNSYVITSETSKVPAFVIATQEELIIAKHTLNLINS